MVSTHFPRNTSLGILTPTTQNSLSSNKCKLDESHRKSILKNRKRPHQKQQLPNSERNDERNHKLFPKRTIIYEMVYLTYFVYKHGASSPQYVRENREVFKQTVLD